MKLTTYFVVMCCLVKQPFWKDTAISLDENLTNHMAQGRPGSQWS